MSEPTAPKYERYLALDVHKHYLVVGGVNAQQQVVLPPRRLDWEAWQAWITAHLQSTDAVVLEATTNAWTVYDQVAPRVGRAVVANPLQVKLIAAARVKTDKQDVLRLAHLLAADLIPEVWVPPVPVRELRALLAHRQQLIKQRTQRRNQLQSVLHRHLLAAPPGELFAPAQRAWWQALALSPTERLRVNQDLATLDHLAQQSAALEAELERLSMTAPWAEALPYLIQLPGFGLLVSLSVLAAVGDIRRFETAKHLVGYAGLGASVHDSGQTRRTGHITKQGRPELRWALVEAAWRAVDSHPFWKGEYDRLAKRMNANAAIVAIARKLLVAVWHVLTERAADCHADPAMVAAKLMRWAWDLTPAQRGDLTPRQFVRYQLMHLQLGADLSHITQGKSKRRIASVEELLALKPELRSLS